MSFQRPTLGDIVARTQADFVSRFELLGAVLRRSVVFVLSRVIAGATHMLHGHLEYLGRQLFPDQSDDAFLVRQASLFGITKNAPSFARATATATGSNGNVAPAGSKLTRSDGTEYTLDADATISSGTATLAVTAVLAGADPTLAADVVLSFESPIAGIDSTATVTASTADGSDQESTDELRVRLLARMAEPPHGGTVADWIAFAKLVTGVTRVWVTPFGLGPGTIVVRFVRDDDVGSIIPDSGEVADVQASLDLNGPAHATPTAVAPTLAPLAVNLHIVPDTTASRAAVAAELADLFVRTAAPGAVTLLSAIETTIGSALAPFGTFAVPSDFTLTAPAIDTTHTTNQLPALGTITWS